MANKRITDLPAPNTLIGTETLIADQRNADFISGFNTVQIPIFDLSEFILIGQPNLSITEDAEIGGNLTVANLNAGIAGLNSLIVSTENGITAEGIVTINSDITIAGDIIVNGKVDGRDIADDGAAIDQLELDVVYLSGAIDDLDPTNVAADIVYLSGSIDFLSADVDFLSGSIDDTNADVVFLNNLIVENSVDVTFLSGSIDDTNSDVTFLSGSIDAIDLQQVTNEGNTTTNSLSVASLTASNQIFVGANTVVQNISGVDGIQRLTQTQYNNILTPDVDTLYIIVG